MQSPGLPRVPGEQTPDAVARSQDETLSDRALVGLLGGIYLGGLGGFVAVALVIKQMV